MSWIAPGSICLSLSPSFSLFWCLMHVCCQHISAKRGNRCFVFTGWLCKTSEITEGTSVFERDIGKTWFMQQRWKTTETNKACSCCDLVNFSFLLLKYAEFIICFVFIRQQENARFCVVLYFYADA